LNFNGKRNVFVKNRTKIDYVLKKVRKHLRYSSTACDIGVGDGYLLTRLNAVGLKVTGIEISGYAVKNLRDGFKKKGLDIRLIQGDITNIALENNQFDVVTCFDVLEHLRGDNLKLALETLRNILVNGGMLIGTLPLRENLDANMVLCPECGHRFHAIGHFHSFQTIKEIGDLLLPNFIIIQAGEVPFGWFRSDILNSICTLLYKSIKSILHRKVVTTACFVAKMTSP